MKYKEFHRKILASGWKFSHAEGSHYFYTKDGIEVAIQGVLARLDEAGDPVGRAPEALPKAP